MWQSEKDWEKTELGSWFAKHKRGAICLGFKNIATAARHMDLRTFQEFLDVGRLQWSQQPFIGEARLETIWQLRKEFKRLVKDGKNDKSGGDGSAAGSQTR